MGRSSAVRSVPNVWIETAKPGLMADASDPGQIAILREASQLAETHGQNDLAYKLTALADRIDERSKCAHCASRSHHSNECMLAGGTKGAVEEADL